jgi:hypothetical protein
MGTEFQGATVCRFSREVIGLIVENALNAIVTVFLSSLIFKY